MWKQWAHLSVLGALCGALLLGAVTSASAADEPVSKKEKAKRKNDLIKVVQPKPVTKKNRLEFTGFFAYQPNDDFVRGYVPGAIVGWHITEGLCLEVTAAYAFHSDKQLLGTIRDLNTQPKVLDRMTYLANGGFGWAPIYGKISILNRYIITYDFYVAAGAGITATQLEITDDTGGGTGAGATTLQDTSFFDTYIGLGQRYFWRRRAAFRIDVRNYSYVQVVDDGFNVRNNLLMGVGFSFLL